MIIKHANHEVFYMKSRQVEHSREEGKKEGERVRERERERFGEQGRATQQLEKMAWVDFDLWSKSTTPENFLKVSINNNNRRIKHQSSFGVASNILPLIWLYSIRLNNTESTTLKLNNVLRCFVGMCDLKYHSQ
jgi:hypothetical protein